MANKSEEKIKAISLRKEGLSYVEILKRVPVSKSTLSVWLRDIGLAKQQKQRLTLKRKQAQLKAQEACRNIRISREKRIVEAAKKEVSHVSKRELWLIGVTLYWAEGTKQKTHNVSQKVSFNNSDPRMILLFDTWLRKICQLGSERLAYSIYIHRTGDAEKAKLFWGNLLNTGIERVYFKNHIPKTNRKNTDENYYGLLRIDVKKSTDLNRQIKGWVLGIADGL
ncbi:MAG: hypothetical protein WCG84_02190 [Candidatus Moraniibacteriota bacterium]